MVLPAASPHDIDNLLSRYRTARAQQALFDVRGGAGTGYDEFVDAAGNETWQAQAQKLNPFTHLAVTYQEILFFKGPVGHFKWLLLLGAISIVFFFFCYWVFDRLRDTFAEEV